MTREDALATARALQLHPFLGQSLTERIADALLAAYEDGAREVRARIIATLNRARTQEDQRVSVASAPTPAAASVLARLEEVLTSCRRCGAQVSEAARETHECAR